MRTWIPKADELSRARVAELQRFCWQYREKRARIAAKRGGGCSGTIDGLPRGRGGISRPTERTAIDILEDRDYRDIQMIEEAAKEATSENEALYTCLMANVCDRVLPEHMSIPAGRRQFYELRRRFFWILDKKR